MRAPRLGSLAVLVAFAAGTLAPATLLATPAGAVTPPGGCWVWGGSGADLYEISTSLAPWTDPDVAPAGPADYTMTLSPAAPRPGENVTISLTFNKGPKNGGPKASVSGRFDFSANGQTVSGTMPAVEVKGASIIPGSTVTATFPAVAGANTVTFAGVQFRAAAFDINIDCNGQTSGVKGGDNPRTKPLATNVTASVTGAGEPVAPQPTPTPTATPSATPTKSPSPSPTKSPTASPTKSPSASPNAQASTSVPAKGKAEFACVLNPLGSDFSYPATIAVSGFRPKTGAPVQLRAQMSDLPGIAPLPIDGRMDVTLGLVAGGKSMKMAGGADVKAPPKQPVPVPALVGTVSSDADEMEIEVKEFTFAFKALSIDADCKASGAGLGKLTVGSKAPADGGGGSTDASSGGGGSVDASSSGGGSSGTTTSLPQTGDPASLPVLGLWAGALVLFGAAGLLLVPRVSYRRQH
ncbi:hypothetical protein IEZ26_19175 [Nocardioides cavernae]|uniref:LPXTG cell wall anchor domain-containing protein n=1 Tax=Nocardioides cavernae TaxID=1921566 RepID=A0ABR8NF39_9ACTN|nr:hypothetical protein [Nocardioides cavernae]MBD3926750.1 hypothetical protein [Nocardioides cavernae]MBM7512472.1 hypothetical protein [Nocardioides cavernae]